MAVVVPLQRQFLPAITGAGIVLFLPHGLRVLTAWLHGWASIPLLLPGSSIGMYLIHGLAGFEGPRVWMLPLVVSCGYIGVVIARAFGAAGVLRLVKRQDLNWKQIVLAAVLASLVNSVGHGFILELNGIHVLVFLIGDTLGTIVLLLLLMLVFRWWRRFEQR